MTSIGVPTKAPERIMIFRGCSSHYFTDRDMMGVLWGAPSPRTISDSPQLLEVAAVTSGLAGLEVANWRRYGRRWYSQSVPDKYDRVQGYADLVNAAERYAHDRLPHGSRCPICQRPYRRRGYVTRYHHYGVPIDWQQGTYIVSLVCTHLGPDNPYYFLACSCLQSQRPTLRGDHVTFDRLPSGSAGDEHTSCLRCGKVWHYRDLLVDALLVKVYNFQNQCPDFMTLRDYDEAWRH